MVMQTPISCRIYSILLWKLDQEAMISGIKRNAIINIGVEYYINVADRRREYKAHRDIETRRKIVRGLLSTLLPEAVEDGLI